MFDVSTDFERSLSTRPLSAYFRAVRGRPAEPTCVDSQRRVSADERQTLALTCLCSRLGGGYRGVRARGLVGPDAEDDGHEDHDPRADAGHGQAEGAAAGEGESEPCTPPAQHGLALAGRDGGFPGDELRGRAAEPACPAVLGPSGAPRPAPRRASAAHGRLALHPPVRGELAGLRRPVLGRAADGPRLHGDLRTAYAAAPRLGRPLDAARADVGCRARAPQRSRLLAVAEHGPLLRPDLISLGWKAPRER